MVSPSCWTDIVVGEDGAQRLDQLGVDGVGVGDLDRGWTACAAFWSSLIMDPDESGSERASKHWQRALEVVDLGGGQRGIIGAGGNYQH